LVGEVTELPGCYTQARDMVELEANIREAIQAYLETVLNSSCSRRED
jgi:predicted RNase H-like HicB family nuclease